MRKPSHAMVVFFISALLMFGVPAVIGLGVGYAAGLSARVIHP